MSLADVRFHLADERVDEPGYAIPAKPTDWAALTDEELFRLRRKIENDNQWAFDIRIRNELETRLILSLSRLSQASEKASWRLEQLTWVLVVLTAMLVIATVALIFNS